MHPAAVTADVVAIADWRENPQRQTFISALHFDIGALDYVVVFVSDVHVGVPLSDEDSLNSPRLVEVLLLVVATTFVMPDVILHRNAPVTENELLSAMRCLSFDPVCLWNDLHPSYSIYF